MAETPSPTTDVAIRVVSNVLSPEEIRKARRGRTYRKWRRRILAGEPLCRPCRERGYTVAAMELDHLVPVEQAPERFWDEANVQPICVECHRARHSNEETPEQAAWRERLEALE